MVCLCTCMFAVSSIFMALFANNFTVSNRNHSHSRMIIKRDAIDTEFGLLAQTISCSSLTSSPKLTGQSFRGQYFEDPELQYYKDTTLTSTMYMENSKCYLSDFPC